MFTANPETKELFSQFQSLGTADEMRVSEKFQEHGEKVTGENAKKMSKHLHKRSSLIQNVKQKCVNYTKKMNICSKQTYIFLKSEKNII